MSFSLSTIASFPDVIAAGLARNFLESQGIEVYLIDESTVATDWLISGAIGGVKLQVPPLQAERAGTLLAELRKEMDDEAPLPEGAFASEEDLEELRIKNENDAPVNQLTDRLFRCAVFGLVFWPLQFYSLYLIVCIWGEDSKISADRRWKLRSSIGLALLSIGFLLTCLVPYGFPRL